MSLNIKQELFCQEYIKNGGNATLACEKAYGCKNYKHKTVIERASKLKNNSDIQARIAELKQSFQEKFEYSIKKSFQNLQEIQESALAKEDLSNALKAEELKGKLCGLYKQDINLGLQDSFKKFLENLE